MRLVLCLLMLPLLAGPALADDVPKAAAHPARLTWQAHFVQANLAHDGHLTVAEAKDGFPLIAKHFDDIDVDHKGYVTENDVQAWRVIRKVAHRLTHPRGDGLKPLHAFQLHLPNQPAAPTMRASSVPGRTRLASRATRVDN
jgi:hypothetical protein